MKHFNFLVGFVVLAIAGFGGMSVAQAQNPSFGAARQIIDHTTVQNMSGVLQAGGFTTKLISDDPNSGFKVIEASSAGGGVMYVTLRSCSGAGEVAPCQVVQPYGFFEAEGVTLALINKFNLEYSKFAFAGLMSNGSGILVSKIYLQEGTTPENFLGQFSLFFADLQALLQSISPGALATVNYSPSTTPAWQSFDGLGSLDDVLFAGVNEDHQWVANEVGRDAPSFLTEGNPLRVVPGQE